MRNVNRVAVSPRSKIWADLAAQTPWRFYCWRGSDGSGNDLAEVNGLADTADYSGTAPSWSNPEYGPAPVGDGGWEVPAGVENMYDLSVAGVVVTAAWVTITASDVEFTTAQESIISVGVDNETEANEPAEGHFRMEIGETGVNTLIARTMYRNAAASHASAPAQQQALGSINVESDGVTNKQIHFAAVLSTTDGSTVSYALYVDGVQDTAGSYTVDGSGPLSLSAPSTSRMNIGARIQSATGTVRATGQLGSRSSGAKIRAVVAAAKVGGTQTEGINLVQELYKYPNEAPRGLI